MNQLKFFPLLRAISRNKCGSSIHLREDIAPVNPFYMFHSNTYFRNNELDKQSEQSKHGGNVIEDSGTEDLKKDKKKKQSVFETPLDIRRYDFKVGQVLEVDKHPPADTLYVQKINCGEPNPRNVVSGLVKHVSSEELKDRLVVVLCNVKPAKMRGIPSEAMVMCASSDHEVELLEPPPNSVPGDVIECPGFPRQPDTHLKSRVTSLCAPNLLINQEKQACYKETPLLVVGKGPIVVKTLAGVNFR